MRLCRAILIVVASLVVAAPALAKENRSGAGVAFASGTVDVSVPDVPDLDFTGYTLFWKYGFTDHWGLLLSYRDMEDDENLLPGEELNYTQFGVHAVYMWRHGKKVRPHVKFGVANTDIEVIDPTLGTASEDELAFSVGGGLEAGSERIAFFADYDFTQFEISGIDFDVANLSLGIIFKY